MAKKKTEKNEINYGTKALLNGWKYDPKDAKVLISIRLDGDVLNAIRSVAKLQDVGYQTLINDFLRGQFVQSDSLPSVKEVEKINKRLDQMNAEIAQLKKHA
jgi:uncharacterized protein (DUF4415 family)